MLAGKLRLMGVPENIKALRHKAGFSQPELAKRAGVSQQLISQLENGKNLTTKYLPQIAAALGAAMGDIDEAYSSSTLGPAVAIGGRPAYAGVIQAGAFLAVDDFNQDPEPVPDFVTYYPGLRNVRQYAWRVRGDSMDRAGILDGMWVVGADATDYAERYQDIENGELVVVERTRDQGAERELTVKEIRYYRDRYELHPNSSNPSHKPIVVPHDLSVNANEEEVRVLAVVLASYTDLRRRRG